MPRGTTQSGEVADLVKSAIRERMNLQVNLDIKHIQDFRNYKVSTQKAANVLSFHPTSDVKSIVYDLVDNFKKFQDLDNANYSNINTFKKVESVLQIHDMQQPNLAHTAGDAVTV